MAVASQAVPTFLYEHPELLGAIDLFPVHVIIGAVLSTTVIVLDAEAKALPHMSVAVQVSVIGPQPLIGAAVNVDGFDVPVIKHPPLKPLVYEIVLGPGIALHDTVIGPGAVIVGSAAGLTVMILDCVIVRPQLSVYIQLSVIVPPQ